MNTRKTIGISMIALLVVALSVSMAAAESIVVSPGTQSLQSGQTDPGGSYATYNIAVSQMLNPSVDDTHTIYATTTLIVSGSGTTTDLMFRFNHPASGTSGWLTNGESWTWYDGGTGPTDTLTLDVMDTGSSTDTQYQFKVYDSFPFGSGVDDAVATAYGDGIPEFATIAIPVVALLGLVFFMRRKEQK